MTGPINASPCVAILIVNWNGWPDLLECLESVFRLEYPDYQVIVCDIGSTDDSVARVLEWAAGRLEVAPKGDEMAFLVRPPVPKPITVRVLDRAAAEHYPVALDAETLVLIRNDDYVGFAGGNNIGLRYALARGFEHVWLLSADAVVSPGALCSLVHRVGSDPGIGLCGSLICYYDAPETVEEAGGGTYYSLLGIASQLEHERPATNARNWRRVEARLRYVSTTSCLVSADFLRAVGLMAEDYSLCGEEIDWTARGRGRYRPALAPASIVYHKKDCTMGSTSYIAKGSPVAAYYRWRARRRLTQRHYPLGLPGLLMLGLVTAALRRYGCGDFEYAEQVLRGVLGRA